MVLQLTNITAFCREVPPISFHIGCNLGYSPHSVLIMFLDLFIYFCLCTNWVENIIIWKECDMFLSELWRQLLSDIYSFVPFLHAIWCWLFRYIFDLSKREADELRSIQKMDLVNWYKTYLQQSSPKCRRLAVRVWGDATKTLKVKPVIKDVADFKMSCNYYTSLC